MTSERWQQVEAVFHTALGRDPLDRASFVREACAGDEGLRSEVESLLAAESSGADPLRGDAVDALAGWAVAESADARIGYRLGSYELTALLGVGGMADVYRARDTRLGRDVAVKILPEIFAADSSRRVRFEREARLLAALSHPHIASIYGFEDGDGIHALVLELVEGETLARRLQSGALPVIDALAIARQIASALQAAHEKGIVHRDLKPRNIALTPAGVVKVLDFGLAKAVLEESGGGTPVEHSATAEGTILGTTPYMSPEQTRGQRVDAQTDIWAFGCVLFEMLSGRRAFEAATVSDAIAAILNREPDWDALPRDTPPGIAHLVRQCLEKDRSRRLHDITQVQVGLDAVLKAPPPEQGVGAARASDEMPHPTGRARRIWFLGLAAAAVLVGLVVGRSMWHSPSPAPATRLSVSVPGAISPQLSAVVSPDGQRIAFVASGSSGLELWIRDLNQSAPRALAGTANAAHPFWSPDGRFVGFIADGKVKKVAAAGGPVQTMADTAERAGPSWGRDGHILFVSRLGELGVVPSEGGPVTTAVANLGGGREATWPHFLPDGRHFLFFVRSGTPEQRGVYVGALGSNDTKQILQSEFKAAYAGGYLWFVRDEALMAQPFDLDALTLKGTPSSVADDVWTASGAGQASFSVSESGALAYVTSAVRNWQLAWVDRRGRVLEHVGGPARYSGAPQIAPDDRRVAVTLGAAEREQVWLIDTQSDTTRRLTYGTGRQTNPIWSPDGSRVAFKSGTGAGSTISVKNADGTGADLALSEATGVLSLTDWSLDGRYLVYSTRGARSLSDIWFLPLASDRRPKAFLETAFNKTQAQVSPDGRWMAYTSYESGRDEVYVERFPSAGDKRQISTAGGVQPRWRRDGRELFYVSLDQRLTALPVDTTSSFRADTPTAIFRLQSLAQGSQSIGLATLYAASSDGQRFLCFQAPEQSEAPIRVVLNWPSALPPR